MRRPAVRMGPPLSCSQSISGKEEKEKKGKGGQKGNIQSQGGAPPSYATSSFLPSSPLAAAHGGIVTICPTLVSRRKDMIARVAHSSLNIRLILGAFRCFCPQRAPMSFTCPGSAAPRPRTGRTGGSGIASRYARTTRIVRGDFSDPVA